MKTKKEDIKIKINGDITEEIVKNYNENLAKRVIEELGIEKAKKLLEIIEKNN